MLAARLRTGTIVPFDWADLSWFPFTDPVIRIEDELDTEHYTVRAELPGIDPAKDVDITYADGTLRLTVTRIEEERDKGHTEFRYNTFHRTLPMPPGSKDETLSATYKDGILEITVSIGEPHPTGRHIPVAVSNGKAVKKTS